MNFSFIADIGNYNEVKAFANHKIDAVAQSYTGAGVRASVEDVDILMQISRGH